MIAHVAASALDEIPGGSVTLIFLVSVMAALVLVLLFTALLLGAHRRYRMLLEHSQRQSREMETSPAEVDLWTEAAQRLDPAPDDEPPEEDERDGEKGDHP